MWIVLKSDKLERVKKDKDKSIEEQLLAIKSDLPQPSILNDNQKRSLIEKIGPKTVRNIIKAKKDFDLQRIPFLFNSIDSKIVIDILNNEWDELLEDALNNK